MNFDKRKSGIRLIGDLAWGSHFCQFYQSKDDLLDLLLPYLKTGLDGSELCVLVAAPPLGAAAAKQALQKAVPRFAEYAKQGRMEIVPYSRWMAAGGASGKAIVSRLDKARLLGLDGVRLAVCTLPPKTKSKAAACIGAETISRHNVIGMYAYPRDKFDAVGLMEAVKDHRAALVRNGGKWEVIESIQARTIRDELKRSEQRYRSLFGNMLHGFAYCKMLYDEAGKPVDFVYLEVNEEFGRLTGLQNVVGKKVTEAIPGIRDSHPELFETYSRVARTGRPEKFEIEFRPLGRWLSISAYSPERDYFVAIFDNITDRKRAETALQETHDRMRAVLESIADGFFSVDAGWKFTYINRKAGALWKRNPEELLGKSLWDIVPQAAGTVFEEQYSRCLAEQMPVSFEAVSPITGKWVEVRAYPSREGLSVYFSDISERKRSEEALRENEKQFRTLADSIPNLAWWADSDGYITWYNQRWYEYTGTTPEQMQGWGWQSVHDPEVLPKVMERWQKCLATGKPFDMEFPLRGGDGVFRPFLTRVMPVKDAGGKVLRWFGTNTDISGRQRAEEALQRSMRRFELLARTSNELLQTTDPQRAVESLCRKVMEHLGCDAFFNYLVDEKSGRLHLNACSGIPAEEAKRIEWLDFGSAVCGSVALGRARIVAEHIPTTPDERTKLVSSYGIKAYACNPILGPGGKIIGTLSFGTCSRETFSEDDLSLMTVVTDQVAVAMIRMQDEQALRQAHDELERRVRERTAELAQANRELEQEIAVRTIAEKELRESEARFRTSVESLLDGYAIFSALRDSTGRITDFRFEYINEAGCRINGKSRNEHLGHTLRGLFPAQVDIGLFGEYVRVVETGQPLAKSFVSEDAHADGSRRARAFDLQAVRLGPGIAVVWRDVTDQKQVEEALRSANSYNRSLLEASLDPLVTIAVDGKITDVNEATIKVTGAAREKLIGTDFSNYFTEPRKAQEGYEQVFAKGFVTDYPLTIRHTDGRLTAVLYNASVYCDPQGRVMGVFAAARDVTEKRKTEEALRQASAYNRSLLEASLDPLVTISAEGKITDVNIATETVTGYSRIDLIGTDFSDYFQDPDKARAGYQQVFREGSVKDYPLEIRHRDGRVTPVLYNATVYRDNAGKVIGVFAAARDITERRETERRTALTNELLKLYTRKFSRKEYLDVAVELIRDWSGCHHTGVRIADPGGNIPYESCVGYNPDFLETENRLSVKSDHCICTRVVVGTPESSERAMMTPSGSFYSNQTLRFVDNLSKQERGQYRGVCMRYGYTSLAVVPIRHGEAILGAIHVADERPDRVPLGKVEFIEQLAFIIGEALFRFGIEEELRQLNRDLEERVSDRTAQLQSANKELEAFAYSVSHDLRTPLRSIDGFSHAILEDYANRLDETGRDYFERIRAAAAKMGQLIDALLNLSRVSRGELKRVPVNLGSLAQTVVDELRKSHGERTVQVRIAENMTVDADPIMMRVVLENLLSNAWKFTGKRERAEIELGSEKRDNRTVYFVRDNGAGFDMTYGNKLFTAFQRLHTTSDFPGVGIGLATVQRIVHRHGGTIWAEGEVDKGAVVYFTLP